MNKRRKRTAALLAALIFIVLLAPGFAAAQAADEDAVSTDLELFSWLEAHVGVGGTVTLLNSITLTTPYYLSNTPDTPITIDTGGHGLTYHTGAIAGSGFQIVGDGVDTPVLSITGPCVPRGNWQGILLYTDVTARGDQERGGAAVYVDYSDEIYSFQTANVYQNEGRIRAFGPGAVGMQIARVQELYFVNAAVAGEGALAVDAPKGTTLYFSRLEAAGMGAATAPDDVMLDACTASPAHVGLIERDIIGPSLMKALQQGAPHSAITALDDYAPTLVLSAPGRESIALQAAVAWDMDAIRAIDSAEIGMTKIQGALPPALQGFGLEASFDLELCVEMIGSTLPYFHTLSVFELGESYALDLGDWNITDGQGNPLEGARLFASADGGKTWEDITASEDVRFHWDGIQIRMAAIPELLLYQAEVGGVYSNTIEVYKTMRLPVGGNGGDRSGADRDTSAPSGEEKPDSGGASGFADLRMRSVEGPVNTPAPTVEPAAQPPEAEQGAETEATFRRAGGEDQSEQTPIAQTDMPLLLQEKEGSAASPTPEIPEEYADNTISALSGMRMKLLIQANPQAVTFLKPGVRVEVSSQALAALNLADWQLFTVAIRWSGGTAEALFYVDGAQVSLEHTVIVEQAPAAAGGDAPGVQPAADGFRDLPTAVAAVLSGGALFGGGGAAYLLRHKRAAGKGNRR